MDKTHSAGVVESPWGGGVSPFAVSWSKLMMWLFIITDALLFAGLLTGYGFVRIASPQWPNPSEVFHIAFLTVMTLVLISSSATMASAVRSAKKQKKSETTLFLLLTVAGGLTFLGMQAYEWTSIIQQGGRLYQNPWGVPQFGAYFFVITGFHGSHVLIGAIILTVTAIRSALGRSSAGGVELAGLYWHFVDLVWVFIFTLFYLI